ncbi:hypothetical protein P7C73_g313, partial [Tremellales sp. Uapishka_1]
MSIDIDWSLLDPLTSPALSESLINLLNKQLSTTSRPSFIGPVTVTSFDFGTVGPDIEIKDIRDVWRAFDEGDDEGDDDLEMEEEKERERERLNRRKDRGVVSMLDDETYEYIPRERETPGSQSEDGVSIYSGMASPRHSLVGVGIGLNSAGLNNYLAHPHSHPHLHHPQPQSQPQLSSQPHTHPHPPSRLRHSSAAHEPEPRSSPESPLPSLQLHLHLAHTPNIHITLLTSLQINYPSPLFMSLPLKLSILSLSLSADLIFAYSAAKNRLHISIENKGNDEVLQDLKIESEIGHADAHVLKNVGKVEKFIGDSVRKLIQEEFVFPNFHTIAL